MNFPDLHHFEQIRRRLWCNRDFGQAAVMVGSGFSRNAEKIAPGTLNMPTWTDLAEQMHDELDPQNLSGKKQQKITNPLNLASEYEAIFGRSALNDFLTRRIPNDQYNPSKLHKLLMSLPWSDIFTTNYDTLLERTRPVIHDRKYDLICKHEDIPGKMKPRIVKLHGSFPSHLPFIFTEEDYRTYPRKFSPFVNIVQQSIMENAFCLIGFSGNDPNFLNWIGWVRDNFGELTPPIYLCGWLDYSDAEKAVLKQKNILTIDVAPLFPREKWSDASRRHAKALEWFLFSLHKGKPPNVMSWPESNDVKDNEIKAWEESENLPELVTGIPALPDPGSLDPSRDLTEQALKRQCRTWQKTRQAYPGWVICPRSNRENLWDYTKGWVEDTFAFIEKLSAPDDLLILYELNWRLEITLTPLFSHWVNTITTCLQRYNPYPELLDLENADIRPDQSQDKHKDWNWKLISKAWVELTFALSRVAREDHNEAMFNQLMGHLDKVTDSDPEWRSRWFHEKCLFHMFRFEYQQALQILETWPSSLSLDFWEVKRAAIYAEFSDVKEAERIAESALDRIRSRQQPYSVDYSLYSQESWAMYLLQMVKENEMMSRDKWFPQYRERWSQLETFRCNPHDELEVLAERMDRVPEPPKLRKEKKQAFYPGTTSTTYHYSNQEIWYSALPAFNSLRMLEEAGVPIRCDSSVPYYAGQKAAKWIRPYAPLWSVTTIVRSRGDSKCVDNFFNFTYLAVLSQETIDYLYSKLHDFLSIHTQGISKGKSLDKSSELEKLRLMIELTSRTCFRLDNDRLKQLLNIAINFYRHIGFLDHSLLRGSVDKLFQGIFYTLSNTEILNALPDLLLLPIAGERGFEVQWMDDFPEPLSHINLIQNNIKNNDIKNNFSEQILHLIQTIKQSDIEVRSRAISRISKLYKADCLNDGEKHLFAEALWSKLDSESQLPEDKYRYKWAFLSFPEPEPGKAKQKLLEFLLSQQSIDPINTNYFQDCLGSTKQPAMDHGAGVDWSSEDVKCLLDKILNWWDQHRDQTLANLESPYPEVKDRISPAISKLITVVSHIVLPRLGNSDNQVKASIRNLIQNLDNAGFCVITAMPMTLFILPDDFDQVSQRMREALTSISIDEIQEADLSLFYWLAYSCNHNIPKPPSDLLDILVNRVVTRRQPGLRTALGWLSNILKEMPEQFNNEQLDSLSLALKYLLQETNLPTLFEFEMELSTKSLIGTSDRPEYQKICSQLAYRLHKLFLQKGRDIPEILIQWKNFSENSVLPEVRKIWQ
jgi:SIR2-like domain